METKVSNNVFIMGAEHATWAQGQPPSQVQCSPVLNIICLDILKWAVAVPFVSGV